MTENSQSFDNDEYYSNDEEIDDSNSDEETDLQKINVQITNKSVKSVYYEFLQDNNLLLSPEYQRNLCWSAQKMNLFINTIYKGWIVPNYVIYTLSSKEQHKNIHSHECIDGQHRLTVLKYYIENSNKNIYCYNDKERIYYNMPDDKLKEIKKNCKYRHNIRNLTREEKTSFDNFQMSFHMISCSSGLNMSVKCDIFNRLQNGEKVSSFEKLKNCQNIITNTIKYHKLLHHMKEINFNNKINFSHKTKPKDIDAYNIYFLIRSFLIIDKKSLDINYLDINIKKYLDDNMPCIRLKSDIDLLLPKVCEITEWIAKNDNIKEKLLDEVLYLYICIYAIYDIKCLENIVLALNTNEHNDFFKKINNINTYKSSSNKVTSSDKMNSILKEIVNNFIIT